jgi:hypothetical protein
MNALHLVFRTGRFNLSKVGAHFINPCCFGEDLAAWLEDMLSERGIEVGRPYQEDWGWEVPVKHAAESYYLCLSGNTDGSVGNPDEGEWRIIVEKRRSLGQRLAGRGKITSDDGMLIAVKEILTADPSNRGIRVEHA